MFQICDFQLKSKNLIFFPTPEAAQMVLRLEENPNIIYFIPEEGSALAIESMCIPKDAPHKFTAEYFMNYILTPKVHGTITNTELNANPNDSAKIFINPIIINDNAIFIDNSIIDKSQYIMDVGKSTILYDKVWTSIKAN